jgi:hypothetical protein
MRVLLKTCRMTCRTGCDRPISQVLEAPHTTLGNSPNTDTHLPIDAFSLSGVPCAIGRDCTFGLR